MTGTGRSVVAGQARAIAEQEVLLDLAVEIPPDRLPPLLLAAALGFLRTGLGPGAALPAAGWSPAIAGSGFRCRAGRVSIRAGARTAEVLGRAHPGAAWLEWW